MVKFPYTDLMGVTEELDNTSRGPVVNTDLVAAL